MNNSIVTKAQGEKPVPEVCCRYVLTPGDYAYSSMWGGDVSGTSCPSAGRRRGWFAGLSSCGLRRSRRWSIGVYDGVGVNGLMSSSIPICMCLNLQLFAVYIGSFVNILGRMIGCGRSRVRTVWLLSGWLCENQPEITGLY
jgi:hypothetical protein